MCFIGLNIFNNIQTDISTCHKENVHWQRIVQRTHNVKKNNR